MSTSSASSPFRPSGATSEHNSRHQAGRGGVPGPGLLMPSAGFYTVLHGRSGQTRWIRSGLPAVKKEAILPDGFFFGDPYGNRTHVTAVKGRCLNRLTNGPGSGNLTRTDDTPGMNRMLYQLSYAALYTPRLTARCIINGKHRFVNTRPAAFLKNFDDSSPRSTY